MIAAARLAVLTGAVAASGLLAAVDADAEPNRLRMEVSAASPGAALDVLGRRLSGKRTKVSVAGRRARVLSGNRSRVRIVVPAVGPGLKKVVARAGLRKLVGKLRVLGRFRGEIGARPDKARAASATIGADGGTITATGRDGTRYTLDVPAGAAASLTDITVTPVARFTGVPLSAGVPVGVTFAPEHLTFAKAALLKIAYRSGVPKHAVGFTFDSSTGAAFAIARSKATGGVLQIPVDHFSGAGSGLGNPQDFANIVQAELNKFGNRHLTFGEAEELAGLIVQWASVFGASFCATQPVCGNAATLVLSNIRRLLGEACPDGKPPPISTLTQIKQIDRIESLRQQVDGLFTGAETGGTLDVPACDRAILRLMIDRAVNGLTLYPAGSWRGSGGALTVPPDAAELASYPSLSASADRDSDGVVTTIEWLLFLAAQAAAANDPNASQDAQSVVSSALASVLQEGIDTCNDDLDKGKDILDPGQRLAERLVILATEFFEANQNCKPKITVSPNPVGVDTGDVQQFRAKANFTDPSGPLVFDWQTTGGSIATTSDPAIVNWTAPGSPGDYTITASTSLLVRFNVSGSATITVGCPAAAAKAADSCTGVQLLGRSSDGVAFARVNVTNPSGMTFGDQHQDDAPFTGPDLFATYSGMREASASATLAPTYDIHGDAGASQTVNQTVGSTAGGLSAHLDGAGHAGVSATENVSATANTDSTAYGQTSVILRLTVGSPMTADCTVTWDGSPPPAPTNSTVQAGMFAQLAHDDDSDGNPDGGPLVVNASLIKSFGGSSETPHASAAVAPGNYVLTLRQVTLARVQTNFNGSPVSASYDSASHGDCTIS